MPRPYTPTGLAPLAATLERLPVVAQLKVAGALEQQNPEHPALASWRKKRAADQGISDADARQILAEHTVDLTPLPPPSSHVAAVLAERPQFQPVPAGFSAIYTDNTAGLRVNKRIWRDAEGYERSTVALQFAENRKPSRETDSPLIDRIEEAGYKFTPHSRQWQRDNQQGTPPGENIVDGLQFGKQVAVERKEGIRR